MSTTWPKATREYPCPKCGKINRCLIAPNGGAGICWRSGTKEVWHDGAIGNGDGHANGYIGAAHRPKPTRKTTARSFATREAAIDVILTGIKKEHPDAELTRVYEYHVCGGGLLFCVVRFDWSGGKTFRPVHLHKNEWREGDPSGLLPLYRVDELPDTGPIYSLEGEKAVDAARVENLPAITSAHGSSAAEKSDWTPLAGREVVILPDHDEPGAKYARTVATILVKLNPPARVKIVNLPGLPEGGDIVEFLAAGGTREQIESLTAAAPIIDPVELIGGPVMTCLADVEPCEVKWLWPGRLPLGRISLLVGRPGEGKSFLTIDIVARVSTGTPFPDGTPCEHGSVLLICGEDDPADTIRPRLDAHHADVSRVHLLSMVRRIDPETGKPHEIMFTLADVRALESALQRLSDCRLIVIDPIGSFLGQGTDAHRDNEVRGVLAPVAALAAKYGPAVLVVAHRRKSSGDVADDLALGSRAFTGIARAVWHLCRHSDADGDAKIGEQITGRKSPRRLLLAGKMNLAPESSGLAFTIAGDPPSIQWERGAVEMSADDALAAERAAGDGAGRPNDERCEAADWLSAELSDLLEHPVATIRETAASAGFSWRTVQRASKELRVIIHRASFGGGYIWRLPKPGNPDHACHHARQNPKSDNFGTHGTQGISGSKTQVLDENITPDSLARQNSIPGTHDENEHQEPEYSGAESAHAIEDEYNRMEREALHQEGM